jgi:hypothetical protein
MFCSYPDGARISDLPTTQLERPVGSLQAVRDLGFYS